MNRIDGRRVDQLRKISIKKNYIKSAHGSCLIEFGDTRVVCTAMVEESETCRDSHRGILDLFVESPWNKYNYGSFLRWEVTRHPDGWTDEEHAEHEDVITTFDKKERKPEEEIEGMEDFIESIKGKEGMEEVIESIKEKGGMESIIESIKGKE